MFKKLFVSCVSACFELINENPYYSPEPYEVFLNGEKVGGERKENVFSLFGLQPDTRYEVTTTLGKKSVTFTTPAVTQTVNVKALGAAADGVSDDTSHRLVRVRRARRGRGGRV